ncbi:MAG TPA: CapA family protein [Candidatus Parcubacteria bacterium]|nr:CapA family protein [Candidatus Parcubacteria bacterium]
MERKILLLAVLSFLIFVIAFYINSHFYSSKDKELLLKTREGEENFANFLLKKEKLPQKSEEVSLIAVGDISYSRGVEEIVRKKGDINYPFLKIQDYLKSADLVFGNLETPLTPGRHIRDGEMIFRSNPSTAQALEKAGFSVLSLANNHTPNFGQKGIEDTFYYLKEADIKYVGAGRNSEEANQPVFITKKGIKFAFLAYNDSSVVPDFYEASNNRAGTAFMRIERMKKAVEAAKKNADLVIVSMHSGIEYVSKPNETQIKFAHAAIDAGADLVIGHHPHVVQTMEKYKGKYIFYSLGNFVFDQFWSQETREGLTIKVYFSKNGVDKISFLPIVMKNFAQPEAAGHKEADKILKRLDFPFKSEVVYSWDSLKKRFQKSFKVVVFSKLFNKNTGILSNRESADLNNNSFPENYILSGGRLVIKERSKTIWCSPNNWWIDSFILADSNNDGIVDINLSLWKAGDFGSSRPFWINGNDMSVKNHFFIFDFIKNSVKVIWGSSNLSRPNCEFQFADVDGDGKSDLVVIEGDYSQEPKCEGNYVAVWKWNDWGFSNIWRSRRGNFSNLEIEKDNGKSYIIVDSF